MAQKGHLVSATHCFFPLQELNGVGSTMKPTGGEPGENKKFMFQCAVGQVHGRDSYSVGYLTGKQQLDQEPRAAAGGGNIFALFSFFSVCPLWAW